MSEFWICDSCRKPISSVDDGWVEWQVLVKGGKRNGFRLVHANNSGHHAKSCLYDEKSLLASTGKIVGDLPLSQFVGADGLTNLLSYLSEPNAERDELIELIKRIHVPLYEQARADIQSAIDEGVIDPNGKPGFYTQEQLARIVNWAKSGE